MARISLYSNLARASGVGRDGEARQTWLGRQNRDGVSFLQTPFSFLHERRSTAPTLHSNYSSTAVVGVRGRYYCPREKLVESFPPPAPRLRLHPKAHQAPPTRTTCTIKNVRATLEASVKSKERCGIHMKNQTVVTVSSRGVLGTLSARADYTAQGFLGLLLIHHRETAVGKTKGCVRIRSASATRSSPGPWDGGSPIRYLVIQLGTR